MPDNNVPDVSVLYFKGSPPAKRRHHLKLSCRKVAESECCTLPIGPAEQENSLGGQTVLFSHLKAVSTFPSFRNGKCQQVPASWNAGAEWKERCCLSKEAPTEA